MPARRSAASACATRAPWRSACRDLAGLLARIGNGNAKGEYYLTDAVAIARGRRARHACRSRCAPEEALGVNSREQLAAAEAVFQARARRKVMEAGRDADRAGDGVAELRHGDRPRRDHRAQRVLRSRRGGRGRRPHHGQLPHGRRAHRARAPASGPFARFRPGADIGERAHVGNFVEVKNATLEAGAKANHLAYIGDGRVGEGANIGAGTIFCNYDGFNKHFTDIGKGAFIGSNSSLVAPVKIGDGAYIGSGSVITKDVEPDALALERSPAGAAARLGGQVPGR